MWQDWVIGIVQWVFLIALIPSLLHRDNKPALSSAVLTSVLGLVLAFTFSTLALWNAALSSVALSIAWGILAFQRNRINKKAAS